MLEITEPSQEIDRSEDFFVKYLLGKGLEDVSVQRCLKCISSKIRKRATVATIVISKAYLGQTHI